MEPYLLQDEELKELVFKIPGWEIKSKQIQREFNFANFIEAFSFMTKIALICEKYNHHPNWENVYSKVIIRLNTHDLGGITNLDQTLASEINKIRKFKFLLDLSIVNFPAGYFYNQFLQCFILQ